MPSYATIQEALDLYGDAYIQTSSDRNLDGKVDADALQDALDKASSLIDSYIGFRYDVPVTPIPDILKQCAIDIAVYKSSPGRLARTKDKRDRYDDCIAWLKDVSNGKAAIIVEGNADPEPIQKNEPEIVTQDRLMTRDKLGNLL